MQPSRRPPGGGSTSSPSIPVAHEAKPGQRDRQKAVTREALRGAALRLFAERGFRETTADDVAAAVGVSRRTFFLHFTSKDEVLLGHIADQLELLVAELTATPAHLDPAARAWHAVAKLADSMQQRGDLLLQLDLLQQAPELLAVNLQKMTGFEGAITAAVQRWRAAADPDAAGPARRAETADGDGSTGTADSPDPSPLPDDGYALLVGAATIAALRTALAMWQRQDGRGPISELFLAQVQRLRDGLR